MDGSSNRVFGLSDSFYPNLPDANVRRLCKAREFANDVRLHYQTQPCPDDSLLSTMCEILMDLTDALISSKPFHSNLLSKAFTTGFSMAPSKDTPWILRFANSFFLVMTELELRQLSIRKKIPSPSVTATAQPALSIQRAKPWTPEPNGHREQPEMLPIAPDQMNPPLDGCLKDVKEEPLDLDDLPDAFSIVVKNESIEQNPLHDSFPVDVKVEPFDTKEEMEDCIDLPSTSTANPVKIMPISDFTVLPLTREQHSVARKIRRKGQHRQSYNRTTSTFLDIASSSAAVTAEVTTGTALKDFDESIDRDKMRRIKLSDRDLIMAYKIPATVEELTAMSLNDFVSLPLTGEQATIAKQIRRRAKKRLSEQRRKRPKLPREADEIKYVYDHADDSD